MAFILDEHLPRWWRTELNRRQPVLSIWQIGDPGTPTIGSQDPEVIAWCEAQGFWLLTNNRRSMPRHLADYVAKGGHVPGIFVVDPAMTIDILEEQVVLLEGATFADEFRDQIRYLPFV